MGEAEHPQTLHARRHVFRIGQTNEDIDAAARTQARNGRAADVLDADVEPRERADDLPSRALVLLRPARVIWLDRHRRHPRPIAGVPPRPDAARVRPPPTAASRPCTAHTRRPPILAPRRWARAVVAIRPAGTATASGSLSSDFARLYARALRRSNLG